MSLKFINYPVNEARTLASAFCSPEPLDYNNLPNEHFIWENTSLIIKDIINEKNNILRLGWKVIIYSKIRYCNFELSKLYIHSKDKNDQDESNLKKLLESLYTSLKNEASFIPETINEETLKKALDELKERLKNIRT